MIHSTPVQLSIATVLLHKNNHKTSVEYKNRLFFLLMSQWIAGPSCRSEQARSCLAGQLRASWFKRASAGMTQRHSLSPPRRLVQVCSQKVAGAEDGEESRQVFCKSVLSSSLFLSRWPQQALCTRIRVGGDCTVTQQRA